MREVIVIALLTFTGILGIPKIPIGSFLVIIVQSRAIRFVGVDPRLVSKFTTAHLVAFLTHVSVLVPFAY